MRLNKQDSLWAMNYFIEYFSQYERIDQYMKDQKLEQLKDIPVSLPGMEDETDFFDNFDISPEDMEFKIVEPQTEIFDRYLNKVSSHTNMTSIPGKNFKFFVVEKNTDKIVGFVRLGSPTINNRPRNLFLGRPLNTTDLKEMGRFNQSVIMGFVIVPTQPFGYNYLGGKLLAGMCTTHEIRERLNKKYNINICMFETTSLYGSSKSASQYDGMKPLLRFKGLTDSNFAPLIHGDQFKEIKEWFEKRNDNQPLVPADASSRKLKMQTKMISTIKESLRKEDEHLYQKFSKFINSIKDLTEQKRVYFSDYGFSNVKEYLTGETDTLNKGDNYHKFEFDNVVQWWKKLATKRYSKLKNENKIRKELEVWTKDANIQIIR